IIYSENLSRDVTSLFEEKEVLVKIITFQAGTELSEAAKLALISEISRATNQQTVVTAVDRRSNEQAVKDLQRRLFDKTGMFFERKRGEFEDGVREGYVATTDIIDRTHF